MLPPSLMSASLRPLRLPACFLPPCRHLSGDTTLLSVDPADTVQTLKSNIQARIGFPLGQQRLIFGGQRLHNGYTLADYGVSHKSAIYLVQEQSGC